MLRGEDKHGDVVELDGRRGRPGREKIGERDKGAEGEDDGGEEAKGVLEAV